MKKVVLIIFLLMIPLALAIKECPRYAYPKDIPCVIYSTWKPDDACTGGLDFYNQSGELVNSTLWLNSTPYCLAYFNISSIGTYIGNSSIENVVITIMGDDEQMIMTIGLFLIGINLIVFALPFWVRFSKSEAGNYVVRRMFWIAALLLLWFNTTLFRQLASDWGLGIDNFLIAYWWIFTMGVFSSILIMTYVMVVGAMKLMKEAKMRERLGEDGY